MNFKVYDYMIRKLLMLLFITVFFAACTDDNDNDLPEDERLKFLGGWLCTDNSVVFGMSTYSINITTVGSSDSIRIGNFNNLGASTAVVGLVAGNSLTIPGQTVTGISLSGTGIYSGNGFSMNYNADDGQTNDQVSSVCVRP